MKEQKKQTRLDRGRGELMVKVRAFRTLENAIRRMGFVHVAGVDEVGRGCLAGPVVAAAVVLDPDRYIPRICDSKTVTALERERLYDRITRTAVAWGVASADLRARSTPSTSIRRRCARCSARCWRSRRSRFRPGRRVPHPGPADGAAGGVHGDSRCTAIAAASIVAKVTRDRMMLELHGRDPRYGFDRHKGYATRDHLDAVSRFGYSDVHRRSFRPPSLFDRMD